MVEAAHRPAVLAAFPFLAAAPEALRVACFAEGLVQRVPAGAFICLEGNACVYLPLVLEGTARVYKTGERGRELTLYRIEPGDSCVLTASCLLSDLSFPAFAVAETPVEALLVPVPVFKSWFDRFADWRTFVFGLMARRLAGVITVVEEVAFHRVDARIAAYLIEAAGGKAGTVRTTHEAIANELGTAREVVSRLLKEMEHAGLVRLGRGVVAVADARGLAARAAQA